MNLQMKERYKVGDEYFRLLRHTMDNEICFPIENHIVSSEQFRGIWFYYQKQFEQINRVTSSLFWLVCHCEI